MLVFILGDSWKRHTLLRVRVHERKSLPTDEGTVGQCSGHNDPRRISKTTYCSHPHFTLIWIRTISFRKVINNFWLVELNNFWLVEPKLCTFFTYVRGSCMEAIFIFSEMLDHFVHHLWIRPQMINFCSKNLSWINDQDRSWMALLFSEWQNDQISCWMTLSYH